MNMRGGSQIFEMARDATTDQRVQKHLQQAMVGLIKDLKLKGDI
jgi:hypothetical protein